MRIIPKKTKVSMEFFKGIQTLDVFVAALGLLITISVMFSNLPFRFAIGLVIACVFGVTMVPLDGDKGYMMFYYALRYISREKGYSRGAEEKTEDKKTGDHEAADKKAEDKKAADKKTAGKKTAGKKTAGKKTAGKKTAGKGSDKLTVQDITPFTGISDSFIEYKGEYYGMVVQIPDIEMRFFTESRQNQIIDRVYGAVLRTISGSETASLVKLDRPILYDNYIDAEVKKMKMLMEAYGNGGISHGELEVRKKIIQDRIEMLYGINREKKIYKPFHYIVFYHKDKELLKNQVANMLTTMDSGGMECSVLKNEELAVFLKYNYTLEFDEREIYKIRPEDYMDWILPEKISFGSRTVTCDNVTAYNFRVSDYPTIVGNAWGSSIFNQNGSRVVMKIKPIESYKGTRQIDRAIDELREQSGSTGKTSRILELKTHIETLSEVLRLLQSNNETLFDVNIYISTYDYDAYRMPARERAAVLSERKKIVKRNMREKGFLLSDCYMQQYEAYASAQISALDFYLKNSRGIHSGSVAAAFPYVNKCLSDKGGLYIGKTGKIPVFLDFFKRDKERVNSNVVIVGKSGSGKSYATKTILTNLAADNNKIFILDPENEYTRLAENLGGKLIDIGSAKQGRLNPFQIIIGLQDDGQDQNSFHMHLQFLEEFYRQILPSIEQDALEYLNNLTIRMYEEKGINAKTDLNALKPGDYPIFDDLYESILHDFQVSNSEYIKNNLRILINYVSKFATGGRNSFLWNGEATLSVDENFIVFNFQSLLANKNNTIANAQMLLVLKWLDNEIIKNRNYNLKFQTERKIIIVVDEAHVFIDSKYPIALDFMFQMAKRIRKYSGMQIIITQNIKDFVGTEELERKSTAIINACQYSFIFPLSPNDMHDLCKLYEKAGALNESEQEEIVNNGRGRAFIVTSPSSRTCVDILAGKNMERLFDERVQVNPANSLQGENVG